MAATRSRRKLSGKPRTSPRRKWSKRKREFQRWLFNLTLGIMSVLAAGFVISAVTTRTGTHITITSNDLADRSRLLNLPSGVKAGESEERRIEVEVLNGVGDPGLAGLFTDYLRDLGYDVVRFENAQRYDYPQSLVIGRRQDQSMAEAVALSLGVEPSATDIIPDPALQLDVTIIIGQDFQTLQSYREIMSAQANQ